MEKFGLPYFLGDLGRACRPSITACNQVARSTYAITMPSNSTCLWAVEIPFT